MLVFEIYVFHPVTFIEPLNVIKLQNIFLIASEDYNKLY